MGASGTEAIALIVGLGNPGPKYESTRHNAGFWFVDQLATRCGAVLREEPRFHGAVARVNIAGQECWLLKPNTFMNRSGIAVVSLALYYKILPAQILVAHDELDIAVGQVRLKKGGGHAGHNGLRDIITHLTTPDYQRLRIGIGRPPEGKAVVDFVLDRPSRDEAAAIQQSLDKAEQVMPTLIEQGMERAMHRLHT
jgi:peptidyl-tRNA hydrolase, PTH1 family